MNDFCILLTAIFIRLPHQQRRGGTKLQLMRKVAKPLVPLPVHVYGMQPQPMPLLDEKLRFYPVIKGPSGEIDGMKLLERKEVRKTNLHWWLQYCKEVLRNFSAFQILRHIVVGLKHQERIVSAVI